MNQTRRILLVFCAISPLAGTAMAGPPGMDRATSGVVQGGQVSGDVLWEVEGRVSDEARPAIDRSRREAQRGPSQALDALSGSAPPRGDALDRAGDQVLQGTAYGEDALHGARERVPGSAAPAIDRSLEAGRTGPSRAMDGLHGRGQGGFGEPRRFGGGAAAGGRR